MMKINPPNDPAYLCYISYNAWLWMHIRQQADILIKTHHVV
jgi:hypothetical protein